MEELFPMTMLTLIGPASPLHLRFHLLLCLHEERESTVFADEIKSKMTENENIDCLQAPPNVINIKRQTSRATGYPSGPNPTVLLLSVAAKIMPSLPRKFHTISLPSF